MGLLDQYAGKKLERFQKPKGLLNYAAENPKEVAGLIADFTPIVGDVKSAYDGIQAARQGDMLGAGLGALGALPFMPNMAGMVNPKKTIQVNTAQELFDALGIEKRKVFANVDKLARKHPEHFDGPDSVEQHLTYVFGAKPDFVYPASNPEFSLLGRAATDLPVPTGEEYRTAVADLTGKKNNSYLVRSAFPMSAEQAAIKKKKAGD